MTIKRKTINVQLWISASQAAMIAEFLEMSGIHTHLLSDISRSAIDFLCETLEKKKGMKLKDEGESIHRLTELGYSLDTSKKYRRGVVKLLQQESIDDVE